MTCREDDRHRGPPGIPLVVADIGDGQTVRRVCAAHRVGAVAHFAGKIQVGESVAHPDVYFDVNLVRSLRLLETIRDEGITSCLFSSTAAVYGTPEAVPIGEVARREPVNPYGATKLAFELALAAWGVAFGLRWAALRCATSTQPRRTPTGPCARATSPRPT